MACIPTFSALSASIMHMITHCAGDEEPLLINVHGRAVHGGHHAVRGRAVYVATMLCM